MRAALHRVDIVGLGRDMASRGQRAPVYDVVGLQSRCVLLWGRWWCAITARANCCDVARSKGATICGSYESAVLGDTANNCSSSGKCVGDEIRPSEMTPFAWSAHWEVDEWLVRALSTGQVLSPRPKLAIHHHNPPPQPRSDCRHYRNHGCPLRGSFAVCDHDRLLRIQRHLCRQAQGDAERRQEGETRHRCMG